MRALIKIYSASCVIVVAFFAFFLIPWGLLPFADAVNAMIVGGSVVGLAAFYVFYFYRREGLDFGWFLANRGGFWVILLAGIGFTVFLCGILLFLSPELFVPAFEQGAPPFGIAIVSLFWLALIFMFGFLAFGMVARVVAYARVFRFSEFAVNALIAAVCLALATLFFSLFLEVINDIALRIPTRVQWRAIWIFVGLLIAAGIVHGIAENPDHFLKEESRED